MQAQSVWRDFWVSTLVQSGESIRQPGEVVGNVSPGLKELQSVWRSLWVNTLE